MAEGRLSACLGGIGTLLITIGNSMATGSGSDGLANAGDGTLESLCSNTAVQDGIDRPATIKVVARDWCRRTESAWPICPAPFLLPALTEHTPA